jgi:hypothetical protein
MYISVKYEFRSGEHHFYAVGNREAVIQVIRNVFTNHGMPIHKELDQTLFHFPGGWFDRFDSWQRRASAAFGGPDTDCFSIKYSATNNPLVTMILVKIYHKAQWPNKEKGLRRIEGFQRALMMEFDLFKIPLVAPADWKEALAQNPALDCSPVWRS